jgi:hypothetical protein
MLYVLYQFVNYLLILPRTELQNLYEVRGMREQTGVKASTFMGQPVTCLELGDAFSAIVNNP